MKYTIWKSYSDAETTNEHTFEFFSISNKNRIM